MRGPVLFAGGISGDDGVQWPPAYDNFVDAPAGEIPRRPTLPSTGQLEWAHKALQVTLLTLALIGLLVVVGSSGPRAVVRESWRHPGRP